MSSVEIKFAKLGVDNAPGQESRQAAQSLELRGEALPGAPVDFSHGDVDAFPPIPGSFELFKAGYEAGGKQAYTEYRGALAVREDLAAKLTGFSGRAVAAADELIITPGTQGALFLAMGATIGQGDKVAIMEPDYFANRKLAEFFEGHIVPIKLDYLGAEGKSCAGIDLTQLATAFQNGVKVFLFSNPNNPTGVIYSSGEIRVIAELAEQYGVTVIVDELYSRQIFDGHIFTHLRAETSAPPNLITIMGPSKTESLSGFRLGVAYGTAALIDRMEKLQAIVSLRAPGYSQAVLAGWLNEPEGWMEERIAAHRDIRDELVALLRGVKGVRVRATEAGSYLFVSLPELTVGITDLTKIIRTLTNATVTPGTEFGPQFINSFRLNFSQDKDKALDAIRRALTVVERYRA